MKFNNNSGYILFINLILITLIGLFIPLLIQQQNFNFKILNNRIISAQNIEAVESGIQYQLYYLKKENLLLNEKINLNEQLQVFVRGKEEGEFIYLKASLVDQVTYLSELKIRKENLEIIYKKTYRSG